MRRYIERRKTDTSPCLLNRTFDRQRLVYVYSDDVAASFLLVFITDVRPDYWIQFGKHHHRHRRRDHLTPGRWFSSFVNSPPLKLSLLWLSICLADDTSISQ